MILHIDNKFLDELFRALSVGLSRPSHLASLKHAGKAQFEVIPGKDGPNYFHVSIFTFHRSTFLMKTKKKKTKQNGLAMASESIKIKITLRLPMLGGTIKVHFLLFHNGRC